MKQLKHLIPALALILTLGFAALFSAPRASAATGDVKINETNFPDSNFRTFIAAYDKNSDGTLSAAELKAVKEMDLYKNGISTLKGIEYFTSLTELNCGGNKLTELDLSKNTKLTHLKCYVNSLTSLDLSKNTLLETVDCEDNKLTSLKLGSNTKLKYLYCYRNNLTSLDVSKNTGLDSLYCQQNQLTSLNLSKNTKLTEIECDRNELTSLNLGSNTALKNVTCYGNYLTSLNISKNTGLENLYCPDNQLTSLDVSKNIKLIYLDCSENQLTSLSITKNTKLEHLDCGSNLLTSLNVTNNTKLEYLDCGSNQLTSLDVSKNTALKSFGCYLNQLTVMDISKNTNLRVFACYNNQLTVLDISNNPALRAAYIAGECTEREGMVYYMIKDKINKDNAMALGFDSSVSLTLSVPINDTNFPDFYFRKYVNQRLDSSKDGFLSADEMKAVSILGISNLSIASLKGIECFAAAVGIDCAGNKLSELDVSLNTKLQQLYCYDNKLTSLKVNMNPELASLYCYGNQIPVLDLKGAPLLAKAVKEGTVYYPDPGTAEWSYWDESSYNTFSITIDKSAILLPDGNPFSDVKEGKFYYVPVMWAYTSTPQVTGGTSPWEFSPNETCTRGQVVTFLWRANGCPEPAATANPFKDVKSDKYYYKAVLWAVENKITTGTSPTTFEPGKSCTRGEVVTFLWRSEGSPNPKTTKNPFTDVKSDKFYYKAVLWAVENKITTGTSATTFEPGKTCTRGEVVTFLYRDIMGQ